MSFDELRLSQPIVRAVAAEGYSAPTPIQSKAIPEALAGRDVLGCAQTGTGKTCAFALPILDRLARHEGQSRNGNGRRPRGGARGRRPRALVLCPTRELAMQIFQSFVAYGRFVPLRHTVIFGGVPQGRQVKALRDGIDVVVATPGRLLDLINQGVVDLRGIETLVLDEADRMLDMGFINDIRKIVAIVPRRRQTLFFSATVSNDIRTLSESILRDPIRIDTAPESTTVETVDQRVYLVDRSIKPRLLEHLLGRDEVGRTLVFTRTKHGADRLVRFLRRASVNAEAIHGNKTQGARTRAMHGFKTGATPVLVATDIAARGIDVDEITHVVNFDMPIDPETYVHRIGRTARAGAAGIAVSFCAREEMGHLRAIERRTRIELQIADDVPGLATERPAAPAGKPKARNAPRKSSVGQRRRTRNRAPEEKQHEAGPKRRPGKTPAGKGKWKAKAPRGGKATGQRSRKAR